MMVMRTLAAVAEDLPSLIAAEFFVEIAFAWPGVGSFYNKIQLGSMVVPLAIILLSAIFALIPNLTMRMFLARWHREQR